MEPTNQAAETPPLDMFPSSRPVPPAPAAAAEPDDDSHVYGFTMQDVCLELELLKTQLTTSSSTTGRRKKCANRAKKGRKNGSPDSRDKSSSKYEYTLPSPGTSFDPWTFFNKEISFILFNRTRRETSDEIIIGQAWDEIGKRIAHHKQRHQETGDRIHIFYKNKLHDFKSQIDRSKAVVMTYVLQKLAPEDIQALERRLFPLPVKMFYGMC